MRFFCVFNGWRQEESVRISENTPFFKARPDLPADFYVSLIRLLPFRIVHLPTAHFHANRCGI